MVAGIAIDSWKESIFEHRLKAAGYDFTKGPGVTEDTLMLKVTTNDPKSLYDVVRAANQEAARVKGQRPS